MMILKHAVGIDIAKDSFSACFGSIDAEQAISITAERTFKNSSDGFAELLRWVEQHQQADVRLWFLLEATGVYYEHLAFFLHQQQHDLCVMLPNAVKSFAASTSVKTKTDRVDAAILCRLALERKLQSWKLPSTLIKDLKQLVRERDALVEERTAVKNRLHALEHSYQPLQSSIERFKDHLDFLKRLIKEIEGELQTRLRDDPELSTRIEVLTSISGIGLLSALKLLVETNGFATITSAKQLISYAGLDIVEKQSGSFRGQRHISKKGNRRLRRLLYLPAMTAIRCNPEIRDWYQKIVERNAGSKKAGIIAVARKLLRIAFALWKSGQHYDPSYLLASAE